MKKNSVKYFGIASVLLASCIFVVPLNAQGPRGGGHSGGFSAGGAHGGGVSGGGMHVENRGFSGSRAPERRSDFTAPQRNFDGRDAGRGVPRDVGRDEGRNWRRSPGDAGNIGSGAARIDGNPGYRNIYGERGYYGNPGNHDVYGRPGRPMEPPYPMGPPHPMGPSHPIAAPMYHPYHEPYMPYYYDPVRFRYGWQPDYRPVYPWWIGATEYGAGYAMGYYVSGGTPVYYYYPAETAPSGGSVAVYIDENAGTVQEPASIDASLLEETDPITEAEITQESQSAQIPHSTQASQDVQAFQNAQTSVLVDDSQTA